MTVLLPHQILMRNLRGEIEKESRIFMPEAEALDRLREASGQDFGHDSDAWQRWVSANKEVFIGVRIPPSRDDKELKQ